MWVKRCVSLFSAAYFAVIVLLTYATFLYKLEFADRAVPCDICVGKRFLLSADDLHKRCFPDKAYEYPHDAGGLLPDTSEYV